MLNLAALTTEKLTLHCHTIFSDGGSTIDEMVMRAVECGFSAIGISDHLVLHPTLEVKWGMNIDNIEQYIAELKSAAAKSPIPVYTGLEVDFFPNNPRQSKLEKLLESYQFDYLIGSVHFIDEFPIDNQRSDWSPLSQNEINDIHRRYWEVMKQLIQADMFNIVGHLDLIKKLGFNTTDDLSKQITTAVELIAKHNLTVEINCAGWDKPCALPYPDKNIFAQCRQLGIPVVMNDDAHHIDQLGQHYQRSMEYFLNNLQLIP
ncbi:MAG: histidinol-phosphatase [Victivallaceae bacterium]|nr:histidinol-phosphatase [Victivallaceae bacterium]